MRTELLAPVVEPRLLPPPSDETYELNAEALNAIALVRRFGVADMLDREEVIRAVERMGFGDGAAWLRANRHLYFRALHAAA